jgi:hypothetical protein
MLWGYDSVTYIFSLPINIQETELLSCGYIPPYNGMWSIDQNINYSLLIA